MILYYLFYIQFYAKQFNHGSKYLCKIIKESTVHCISCDEKN